MYIHRGKIYEKILREKKNIFEKTVTYCAGRKRGNPTILIPAPVVSAILRFDHLQTKKLERKHPQRTTDALYNRYAERNC